MNIPEELKADMKAVLQRFLDAGAGWFSSVSIELSAPVLPKLKDPSTWEFKCRLWNGERYISADTFDECFAKLGSDRNAAAARLERAEAEYYDAKAALERLGAQ